MDANHTPDQRDDLDDGDGPLAWEGRVLAVSLCWSISGVIAGTLVALPLTACGLQPVVPAAIGGVLGLLGGGLLEAGWLD